MIKNYITNKYIIIAVIIISTVLNCTYGVFAVQISTVYDTTPGIDVCNVIDEPVSGNKFSWDFYLPFDAKEIDFEYSVNEDTNIKISINSKIYNIILYADSNNTTLALNPVLRHSDIELNISADNEVTISEIIFKKVNISWIAPHMRELPAVTQFEQDTLTASLINIKSPVMYVNGAKRYIDYDNLEALPRNIDGTVYIPVKTLARAFGMYYEDYPEKTYVFLRAENLTEIRAENKECIIDNGTVTHIKNPFVYVNGKAYAPVRKIAELVNKTVLYSGGIIIVDDSKNRANSIINNENYMNYIKSELGKYKSSKMGRVYHVSQASEASDENTGSERQPFLTLNKAAQTAKAGDTVIIHEGIYRETLKPVNNGTESAPITFCAADGENVLISAFDTVDEFCTVTADDKFYNEKINLLKAPYRMDLGNMRNFVLYKDSELVQGRYPNVQTNDAAYPWPSDVTSGLWPTKGNIKIKSKGFISPSDKDYGVLVSDTDLNQEDQFWQGAAFIGEITQGWSLTSGNIEYSTEGRIKLDISSKPFCWSTFGDKYGAFVSDYGYITNSINTVDIPGEWHIEDGYIYIYPPEGETPETLKIEGKSRQIVIDLKESKNIVIKNINTSGGGINMDNSEMCIINGCSHKYLSHFVSNKDNQLCFIDGTADDWITKSDNPMTRGELGICIGGTDCAVINTKIDYSAAAGILLYGKYAYIENNIINNTGYGGAYFSGISCISEAYEDKSTPRGGYCIYNNSVCNTGRAGFYMSSANYKTQTDEEYKKNMREGDRGQYLPCDIAYNYFYNTNLIARDSGGVYIHGNNSGNDIKFTSLHNNVVCNVQGNDNSKDYFQPFRTESYYYNDAWTAGINTYNNIGLATNEKQARSSNETEVYGSEWKDMSVSSGNVDCGIVPDGIKGLSCNDYPLGKPYYAGAYEQERFLKNYNNEKGKICDYTAETAILSEGLVCSGGAVTFNSSNQTAVFKNVDISDKHNRLKLCYSGDRYDKPVFRITVNDGTVSTEYIVETRCRGYDTDSVCMEYSDIAERGNVDIAVSQISGAAAKLYGFDIDENPISEVNTKNYIIGGNYTSYISENKTVIPKKGIRYNSNLINSYNYCYAYNLFQRPYLKYTDIETDSFDSIDISVQLDTTYDGSYIELYMDNIESEPIAKVEFTGSEWDDFQTYTYNFNQTYSAGSHDFYVRVSGKNESSGTINLYHIKFYKNTEKPTQYREVNIFERMGDDVKCTISPEGELVRDYALGFDCNLRSSAAVNKTKFIELDLGKAYEVTAFKLVFMGINKRGCALYGSEDGKAYDLLYAKLNTENEENVYSGKTPVTNKKYRYIRIENIDGNMQSVFGTTVLVDLAIYSVLPDTGN